MEGTDMRHGPGLHGGTGFVLAVILFATGSAGAQDKEPSNESSARTEEVRAEAVIRCELPAEIDRLGSQLTKLGPRRIIETTAEDCAERQGEVVEEPR